MKKFFVFGIALLLCIMVLLSGCTIATDQNGGKNSGDKNIPYGNDGIEQIPMPPANPEEGNTDVPILPI